MTHYVSTHAQGSPTAATVVPGRPATAVVTRVAQELQKLVAEAPPLSHGLPRLLDIAMQSTRGEFVGWLRLTPNGMLESVQSRGTLRCSPNETAEWEKLIRASLQRGCPIGHVFPESDRLAAVSIPIRQRSQALTVLAACTRLGELDLPAFAVILEAVAAAFNQLLQADFMQQLEWEAEATAATVELTRNIQTAESLPEALLVAVNELKSFFSCTQISLALAQPPRPGVRLASISGLSEFDRSAPSVQQLSAAMDEASIRDDLHVWPPAEDHPRHAMIALRRLAEQQNIEAIVCVPLRTTRDERIGVILAEGPRAILLAPRMLDAWRALAPCLAETLSIRKKAEPSQLIRWVQPLWSGPQAIRRRRLLVTAIFALLLLACLPVPHRVKTDGKIEPVVRRFVVAPFDGRLKQSVAKPGDVVEVGEVLAAMDDRELTFELSSLLAERGRAAKQRDTAMADHDASAAQLAELEIERLDGRIQLLRERENQLAIISPIRGVVLKGDLEDAEGAPVKIGQALFEIAPLQPLQLELAIRDDDIAWARIQQSVTARLDGYAGGAVAGQLTRIHPRAEIRDHQNVFVAEVPLDNSDQSLRPGMSGRAWIRTGYRPLAWLWLHKAVHRVRMFTGW